MIHFDVWAELVCSKCAEARFGRHYYGDINWDRLQKEAESQGWTIIQSGSLRDWLCTRCSKQWAQKDANEVPTLHLWTDEEVAELKRRGVIEEG